MTFTAQDSGDFGAGWNIFAQTGPVGSVRLPPGEHALALTVSGDDGFGVELDAVFLGSFVRVMQEYTLSLPVLVQP